MVKIPDTWSDRIPKNISPKRQVRYFRQAFHQLLTEHGFFCVSNEMPEEALPRPHALADMCRYYRVVNRDLFQIVDGALTQIYEALDRKGGYSRYVGTGGFIGINVFSLCDGFHAGCPPFCYGMCIYQQRLMHFQFPGMRKGWCNSFLNLFRDDFPYAMELEKELFLEETLPWLDQMTTLEKYAQWRFETISEYMRKDWGATYALWSQLKLRRWKEADACIQAYFDGLKETRITPEIMYPELKREAERMENIRQAIAREDTAFIDRILDENRKESMDALTSDSKGIDWNQLFNSSVPKAY